MTKSVTAADNHNNSNNRQQTDMSDKNSSRSSNNPSYSLSTEPAILDEDDNNLVKKSFVRWGKRKQQSVRCVNRDTRSEKQYKAHQKAL